MAKKTGRERLFELVFFKIYDVGRSVDLEGLGVSIRADSPSPARAVAQTRRDTPASLSLPRPCVLPLEGAGYAGTVNPGAATPGPTGSGGLGSFKAEAKVYEDGVVTLCVRARLRVRLEDVGTLCASPIVGAPGGPLCVPDWEDRLFHGVLGNIATHIVDPASDPGHEVEAYLAICLLECDEGPEDYIARNRTAIATLLMGADPGEGLHEQKIAETLAAPFSYTANDVAIFDLDRCFIVDPKEGYEDILLIIENANYRLLELRSLDRLLDKRLDVAERDLLSFTRLGRAPGGAVRRKFARIQTLRFVSLFVLENLENSSKIIGDYYLGQIYGRLCALFNTDGWSRSVERRLDVLTSIYEMVKTDNAERRTLVLEIVFIVVCIILPLLQIWQALL